MPRPIESGRPQMTPGYGIASEPEGMLSWNTVEAWLTNARNYWLASVTPDGRPHAAPVWGVWLEGCFWFSTDPASRKARNFAAQPEVVMHLESGDEVVILEGRVEQLTDAEALHRFSDAYEAKYQFRPEPEPGAGFYRLNHRVAYAWREQDFPTSATRWRFA